ncbi:helix-turn-helix domain-containing protein [Microvirga flavescens]|uniref:helix-turn-helix domain-containing protein n=1 Tax=Microvirga flavescens TaxID=2249811 RepID=UPI001FE0A2AB|nr:AraC family transcriptional regulator [Microvirga flavescens]
MITFEVDLKRDPGQSPRCLLSSSVSMLFVPLPFVVSLFLVAILVRMMRRGELHLRENRLFVLLIAAYALQSILIGLRWGYDILETLWVQPVLATFIASLAWVCFRGLAHEKPIIWPHLLPTCLVALLLLVWREPVGAVIIVVFLGYGAALLWLARLGPDGLVSSRLDGAMRSYRALQITALALIGSAVSDIIISFDFAWTGGVHSAAVIAGGNVVALLILGGAAFVASSDTAAEDMAAEEMPEGDEAASPEPLRATEEDSTIAASLDVLMQSKNLYRDVELNLGKIARRLGLPARSVSSAVNRVHGMSVSQYVNNYRVREACRLLEQTDDPITRIVFDAGFLTKSNFNREFLRMTGVSPTVWRQRQR